ncbi:MAG: hypothetical protein IPO40_05905 [Fibrobacteres bacterium]|nr:hypothetical protein [Fibrobacterota bacterium]
MPKHVHRAVILGFLGALPVWSQTAPPPIAPEVQAASLDTMEQNLDRLESSIRKSLKSGGSKPVSFSGEAIFRFIGTSYAEYPLWMQDDNTESKNSFASVRVAMVAAPHKNLRLWSKIAFNGALYGTNKSTSLAGSRGLTSKDSAYQTTPQTGHFDPHSAQVYEDMSAGVTAAIGKATTIFRVGGTLWTEASPLTVWKGQNRMFGWDYVPYELEQPSAQYYEYATTKGERVGRAAWNKKPFQGFQWESMDLPGKLYFMLTMANYEGFQKWSPTVANTANTNGLMYTAEAAKDRTMASKGTGIGDLYRDATVGRLAIGEIPLPGGQALPIMAGVNYVNFKLDDDYAKQFRYSFNFGGLANSADALALEAWGYRKVGQTTMDQVKASLPAATLTAALAGGLIDTLKRRGIYMDPDSSLFMRDTFYASNYFTSFKTISFDLRQNVPGKIGFLLDVGLNKTDTSYFKVQDSGVTSVSQIRRYKGIADSTTIQNTRKYEVLAHKESDWIPAVYGQVSNLISGTIGNSLHIGWFDIPMPLDLGIQAVYAPKDFYSGTNFIMPGDFFFPYEANLLGAGKFAGYDGGTPYVANMTGANFTFKYTKVKNGHLRMNVGYHTQMEKGANLIWLPWRLNGTAFKLSIHQSTTQYDGQGLTDDYLRGDAAFAGANSNTDVGVGTPTIARQIRRFGNDFYGYPNPAGANAGRPWEGSTDRRNNQYAPTPGLAGGIRNDFMSTFENFGAFKIHRTSKTGFKEDSSVIAEMILSGSLPTSTKATQNISLDYGQDLSPLWGGTRPMFMGLYGAFNGVTTGGLVKPGDDKTLLSGYLLRFEPVYQLTDKFWVIGLVGQEHWESNYGVAAIDSVSGLSFKHDRFVQDPRNWHSAPINYTDWAFGAGFDWNLAPRVELHTRLEYFTHRDDGISEEVAAAKGRNDFEAWYLHAETKMWF